MSPRCPFRGLSAACSFGVVWYARMPVVLVWVLKWPEHAMQLCSGGSGGGGGGGLLPLLVGGCCLSTPQTPPPPGARPPSSWAALTASPLSGGASCEGVLVSRWSAKHFQIIYGRGWLTLGNQVSPAFVFPTGGGGGGGAPCAAQKVGYFGPFFPNGQVTAVSTVFPCPGLLGLLLSSNSQIVSSNKLCFTLKMPDCCLNLLFLPRGCSFCGGGWCSRWSPES